MASLQHERNTCIVHTGEHLKPFFLSQAAAHVTLILSELYTHVSPFVFNICQPRVATLQQLKCTVQQAKCCIISVLKQSSVI
jgi:hypothetical protein